jgi:putative phosphoribosyl transferase
MHMDSAAQPDGQERLVHVLADSVTLEGALGIPTGAQGIVLFAHGSGSSRHSPRNRYVAQVLREGRLATFLIDLLTAEEEAVDRMTARLRFDIGLLAKRLVGATDWLGQSPDTQHLKIGYFGASTGAAAALVAATERPRVVAAIVSRGGRPDLAGPVLSRVRAPTLLIVGGRDEPVIAMNREALAQLRVEKRLEIVPGATHLFEEPGTLEEAAHLARQWFERHLTAPTPRVFQRPEHNEPPQMEP